MQLSTPLVSVDSPGEKRRDSTARMQIEAGHPKNSATEFGPSEKADEKGRRAGAKTIRPDARPAPKETPMMRMRNIDIFPPIENRNPKLGSERVNKRING